MPAHSGMRDGRRIVCGSVSGAGLLALVACLPLARHADPLAHREALLPLTCMRAVVRERVPAEAGDRFKHCLAAGLIARHCSISESKIAAWGKEFTDLFDGGDPSTRDLHDDATGLKCARASVDDAAVRSCCESALALTLTSTP